MTLEQFKATVADLARPYTFYSVATASAISIVHLGLGIAEGIREGTADGYQATSFALAVLAGASAIYIGKAVEVASISRHAADVEKVRAAQSSPPPAQALQPPAPTPDAERSLEDPA
jgi:hypothetical protein